MKTPMKSINDVNTKLAANLTSEMERNAMLTRESRRIVDREESNLEAIIRAYMLTKERRYADEAIKRIKEVTTWGESGNVKGDFNDATFVSLSSLAYDALYDLLDEATKKICWLASRNTEQRCMTITIIIWKTTLQRIMSGR